MIRSLLIAILLCWTLSSIAQSDEMSSHGEIKTRADSKIEPSATAISTSRISEQDMWVISKGMKANASLEDKIKAIDVCSEKCKICYNSKECDYQCVEKNCRGKPL